jgi:hypothetical protein
MDLILSAIEFLKSRELGEHFSYIKVAAQFGVNRSTLSRRHQRVIEPLNVKNSNQQALRPQQELELVQYIEKLTKRGLLPTREMIKNFASSIAHQQVSES